jgi:tetratricopeptide (TPR) repeat protein
MKPTNSPPRAMASPVMRMFCFLGICCVLIVLILTLWPHQKQLVSDPDLDQSTATVLDATSPGGETSSRHAGRHSPTLPTRPAEEIVSEKLARFAGHHRELVTAMAKKFDIIMPEEVNRFFTAVQAGHWEQTTNLLASLKELRMSEKWESGLEQLWPAIQETYGVAEQAHLWPAQELLDYGNSIINSLKPGMVYVGGTDAGRFIPTLLADTSEGESPIVVTQSALADGTYLEYLQFRYGDRLNALTAEESQSAFSGYLDDAQKRWMHDQQFPDEPRQIRPGEDIKSSDGRLQISGTVAVMLINERLVQNLLDKNPNLSFALEESTPLKSLYAGATTLGPITEIRANDPSAALTAERAAQSLDYWRSTTQSLNGDTSNAANDAYAKLILGQGNLFLDHNLSTEAAQAYQLANQLSPANAEGVFIYTNLLLNQKRYDEARQVVQTALTLTPDNAQFRSLLDQLSHL